MSLSDPAESSLSNHLSYPLSETLNGFAFTTDGGAKYELSFRDDSDYFLTQSYLGPILSFAIVHISGKIGPIDKRREATIVNVLQLVFNADHQTIITYTCSTKNRQGAARSFAFKRWFEKHGRDNGFLKTDYVNTHIHEYSAAIYRADHPQKETIEKLFNTVFHKK